MSFFAKLNRRCVKLLIIGTVWGLTVLAASVQADDKKQMVVTPFQDARFVPLQADKGI